MKAFILSTAIILATSSAALADTKQSTTTNLTGPYIGVYGGHDWSELDTAAGSAESNDWEAGVFAGYKMDKVMSWTQGYVFGGNAAIEGFYGMSDSDSAVHKDNEWGVSFRPGISILDSVVSDVGINPYLILGYRNTDFEGAGSNRFDGFELGVGTQFIAFGNAGLRLDYGHVWYGEENGVDPDSDDVRLGLSYHF